MQSLSDFLYLQGYLTAEQWVSTVATLTRPASAPTFTAPTSSAAGSMLGQNASAASCLSLEFAIPPISATNAKARGKIAYARVRSLSSTAAKSIRLHLFKATAQVVPASGDNQLISVTGLGTGAYIGYIDVALQPDPSGGAQGTSDLVRIPYELDVATSEKVEVFIEALTAFAGVSGGVWHVQLAADRTS